ncbi:hypothetical protein GCM10022631_25420 [Deinococcus rubellus]|uniref:hypothetical protein n=1 Tax=Deinococcus rubellus TaxID=1889240 RepID=UPI0031E8817B
MNQVLKHPDLEVFLGMFTLMFAGSLLVGGAGQPDLVPISFYQLIYYFTIIFQVIIYTIRIAKTAICSRGNSSDLQEFALLSKIVSSICFVYFVVFFLLLVDSYTGWRLITNPLSAILFFFSLYFLVARAHQRTQATALLRRVKPTGEHGVAAQRRLVAPDFSAAQPPTPPSPSQPPREAATPKPKPSEALTRPAAQHDPFADAVRPADEDE